MSHSDRLLFIRATATRPARVLSQLEGFTVAQAKRVLRRLCPKLHLSR